MPGELTPSPHKRKEVLDRLRSPIRTRDDPSRLLVNALGYERVEPPIPTAKETFGEGIALDLAERSRPVRLAEAGSKPYHPNPRGARGTTIRLTFSQHNVIVVL